MLKSSFAYLLILAALLHHGLAVPSHPSWLRSILNDEEADGAHGHRPATSSAPGQRDHQVHPPHDPPHQHDQSAYHDPQHQHPWAPQQHPPAYSQHPQYHPWAPLQPQHGSSAYGGPSAPPQTSDHPGAVPSPDRPSSAEPEYKGSPSKAPASCPECGRPFKERTNMTQHLKRVHYTPDGKLKHVCLDCRGYPHPEFTDRNTLDQHRRIMH